LPGGGESQEPNFLKEIKYETKLGMGEEGGGGEFKQKKNLGGGVMITSETTCCSSRCFDTACVCVCLMSTLISLQRLKRRGYLFYFLPIKWIALMLSLLLR